MAKELAKLRKEEPKETKLLKKGVTIRASQGIASTTVSIPSTSDKMRSDRPVSGFPGPNSTQLRNRMQQHQSKAR